MAAVGGIIAAASGSHGGGSSNNTADNTADKPSDNSDANNNTAKDTTAPAKPTVEAKMNGFVYITPPADEDTKSVEVRYTDEKGNPQTITITKDADKGWVSSNPNDDIWLNSETGKITLLAHKVKGDSPVNASATDNQGNTGEEAMAKAVKITDTYGPSSPDSLTYFDREGRGLYLPREAQAGDTVVIKGYTYAKNNMSTGGASYNNEDVLVKTVAILTKQQDGSWISDKPEIVPNVDAGNDRTIIQSNNIKGLDYIVVDSTDPSGNQSIGFMSRLSADIKESPEITVKDGFIEITPPAVQDLKSMEVKYVDEAGTVKFTTLTRGENGNWTSDNPDVTIEPATGNAMISLDKTQKIEARAITNSDMASGWHYEDFDKNPTRPSAPKVIPSTTDGSVTVEVPDDAKANDTVNVKISAETNGVIFHPDLFMSSSFDESAVKTDLANLGMDDTITLTKTPDGSWISSNPSILPNIPAGQNSTTIPQDRLTDGSTVDAATVDRDNHHSESVTAQAGKDTGDAKDPDEAGASSNIIISDGMVGSSGDDYASFKQIASYIKMGAGNDILEVLSTEKFSFQYFDAAADMGSGNDIIRISGPLYTYGLSGYIPVIDGGDDFDTLEFVNRDGKAITTTISMLKNFEKIDITGTLNNTVNIQKEDVERNHNTKATVDDSGKSHDNVLIIDGNAGDKVNLNDISNVASSQVTYENKTYHVYHTGSNELWVESDIAVV